MLLLRSVVIGMGILIVLAVCLLVYGMYKKTTEPDWRLFGNTTDSAPIETPQVPAQTLGNVILDIPGGFEIVDISSDGQRLLVSVANGSERVVIVLDANTGQILGRISTP